MTLRQLALATALICSTGAFPAVAQDRQDYAEWSTETRSSLTFRVNAAAVRSLLPEGWSVAASADSPDHVNLSVTFMDRHLVLDAQGQAVGTGSSRYMVMSVQARNDADGQNSTLIINGISPEGTGAYEVYQPAVTARADRLRSGMAEDIGHVEEHWEMVAGSGDSVRLTLSFEQVLPLRRQSRIVIRSGKNTDYTRTYQIDQASDALGIPGSTDSRIESLVFEASGPLYSRLFDGSEVLTGVTATPWYTRQIFVP